MNKDWHASHPMPKNATLDQRVAWHVDHAERCACRAIPKSVKNELARRQTETGVTGKYGGAFTGKLFRYESTGTWFFVEVPTRLAPPVTHSWGRTPVVATVDGHTWKTSVWRAKNDRTLLAVPKKVRGAKDVDDSVRVKIAFDSL